MDGGKVFIWMNLLGFERNDSDHGVQRFLNQTGFVPDGVCALLFHADFFNQYNGMENEYELPADVCAYFGIPQNSERKRQQWTNHNLRDLSRNLTKAGTGLYASIMGNVMNNAFHNEWINEHPEIRRHGHEGAENACNSHFVLKRFKDGSYYEDFFIDKVCKVLTDYEMKGIHLADNFCPAVGELLHYLDYSTDFVEQFLNYSGLIPPAEIASTMGCDNKEAETKRFDWIYYTHREEWIEFVSWRWEGFFKKLCERVHEIGKEVLVLAMYCTDPFETLYCLGIDLKKLVNARVDYITANILPTSCYITGHDQRPYKFNRYMALAPITAAYVPKDCLITMLGLHDPTEEWSAMHHMPCQHERDMYTSMAYQTIDKDGVSRAMDGFFLCLGDGICAQDWKWESERLEISMSGEVSEIVSPVMLWSDAAFERMVGEYIHTRRWTPFKLFYELSKAETNCAGTVRSDALEKYSGTLVVPDFDMLSSDEQKLVAGYDRGSVMCTAKPDFNPEEYGISPEILFSDKFSSWPMTVFAFNCNISLDTRKEIELMLSEDDGKENLFGDLMLLNEPRRTLDGTLVFQKVTKGFRRAMAYLLNEINDSPFIINKPNIILRLTNGMYRIYLFNDSEVKYHRAFVKSKNNVKDVKIISKFPVLPPRYVDEESTRVQHVYTDNETPKNNFEIKIQPGGVSIIDVLL